MTGVQTCALPIYYVSVYDGSATANGQVTVTVNTAAITPGIPQGPANVNLLTTSVTDYTTSGSQNASQYLWHFSPATAGNTVASGTSCQVQWNTAFSGTALLWVNGLNSCGESLPSDTLRISAAAEIGMPEPGSQNDVKVYPNPSSGLFNLVLPIPGVCHVTVSNPETETVLDKILVSSGNEEIHNLDLRAVPSGLYILIVHYFNRQYTSKLSVIR